MKEKLLIYRIILISTFIVGLCSIVYELLISSVSSYFLGDSIKQFSIIIGCYMASMGVGSWISRFLNKEIFYHFVIIELCLGGIGAFSVPLCYIYFPASDFTGFQFFVIFLVSIIGILTGMEIPLLTDILKNVREKEHELSDILTFDYLGALGATLLFPFFLLPFLGVYKSSLLVGLLNVNIGILNYLLFRKNIKKGIQTEVIIIILSIILISIISLAFLRAEEFTSRWNKNLFKHPVVYEQNSNYQNIILSDNDNQVRLYLNGAIQFSSKDEYRYHEALVHLPIQTHGTVKSVLILGGGEGLALREILKYPEISQIDLVELDPAIVNLSNTIPALTALNNNSLSDNRVRIHHADAFLWMAENEDKYDVIISDLPDPTNESLAKLYSTPFYNLIQNRLNTDGIFITQACSPELSAKSYWCIEKTIKMAGLQYTNPFHVNVPSFGNWGFVMASPSEYDIILNRTDIHLKYLEKEALNSMLYFPMDVRKYKDEVEVNSLDRPVLLDYYLEHWQTLQAEGKK